MRIEYLILLQLFTFFVAGSVHIFLYGEGSFLWPLLTSSHIDLGYFFKAYFWTLYAIFILWLLYGKFLRRYEIAYQEKSESPLSEKQLLFLWATSLFMAIICALILFCQNDFSHPFLSGAFKMGVSDFAVERQIMGNRINMNLYNVALHIFMAFSLVMTLFYIRRLSISLLTVAVFIFLASFSLAKSPIADVLLQMCFYYLLLKRSWKPVLYLFSAAGVILLLVIITQDISPPAAFKPFLSRLLMGQFFTLPNFFQIFEKESLPLASLLPPYIKHLFHIDLKSPAKIVADILSGPGNKAAGDYVSLFIGSAYSVMGNPGVIIAPFIVFFNYLAVFLLFSSTPKTPIHTFIFSYLLFRLTKGMNSDISYFVCSGIQIVIILCFIIKYAYPVLPSGIRSAYERLSPLCANVNETPCK